MSLLDGLPRPEAIAVHMAPERPLLRGGQSGMELFLAHGTQGSAWLPIVQRWKRPAGSFASEVAGTGTLRLDECCLALPWIGTLVPRLTLAGWFRLAPDARLGLLGGENFSYYLRGSFYKPPEQALPEALLYLENGIIFTAGTADLHINLSARGPMEQGAMRMLDLASPLMAETWLHLAITFDAVGEVPLLTVRCDGDMVGSDVIGPQDWSGSRQMPTARLDGLVVDEEGPQYRHLAMATGGPCDMGGLTLWHTVLDEAAIAQHRAMTAPDTVPPARPVFVCGLPKSLPVETRVRQVRTGLQVSLCNVGRAGICLDKEAGQPVLFRVTVPAGAVRTLPQPEYPDPWNTGPRLDLALDVAIIGSSGDTPPRNTFGLEDGGLSQDGALRTLSVTCWEYPFWPIELAPGEAIAFTIRLDAAKLTEALGTVLTVEPGSILLRQADGDFSCTATNMAMPPASVVLAQSSDVPVR